MKINSATAGAAGAKGAKEEEQHPRPKLALDAAFKKQRSGLELYVERPGDGRKIEKGSKVRVHYDGWLADTFAPFDSSRKKGEPFTLEHGAGRVIAGWEEALAGVRQGAKIQVRIPAKLAYGVQGVPQMDIPPNADLIFKIEVLKVEPPKAVQEGRTRVVA
ncbi:MAG: FKBP-type peptidyl-prolyl cis-trans isomerase [SAR324 cluster bacterium]|nr:FKBP-type peptidyl-prolyl cis-trans isomerase [SAR324 cluster bacterium]